MTPTERIKAFRDDLPLRSVPELVQRHVIYGDCFALTDDLYFQLKTEISRHFQVHMSEIIVVGSAKLGFSTVPDKRYREFGETSDIDVAIASRQLFDRIWEDTFDFWRRAEYWEGFDDSLLYADCSHC